MTKLDRGTCGQYVCGMTTPTNLRDTAMSIAKVLTPKTRKLMCEFTEQARDKEKDDALRRELVTVAKAFGDVMKEKGER